MYLEKEIFQQTVDVFPTSGMRFTTTYIINPKETRGRKIVLT